MKMTLSILATFALLMSFGCTIKPKTTATEAVASAPSLENKGTSFELNGDSDS